MHETLQPPTTFPANPPHDHTHPRHSRALPRHSRVGRESSPLRPHSRRLGLLPPSTKFDTIQQNPTKSDGNSCARVP